MTYAHSTLALGRLGVTPSTRSLLAGTSAVRNSLSEQGHSRMPGDSEEGVMPSIHHCLDEPVSLGCGEKLSDVDGGK